MKIALTNPPWYYYDNEEKQMRYGVRAGSRWPFTMPISSGYKPFPFFLAYSKSLLENHNNDVLFVDSITAQHTYEQFFNILMDFDPEFIFIETSTASASNDLFIAEYLSNHKYKIVLGGAHATTYAEDLMNEYPFIYAIIKGDYEDGLLELTNLREQGIYKYVSFELDELPYPYRDDNLIWRYKEKTHGFIPNQISVMTSRGCPFLCTFCLWPHVLYDKKYREHSVDYVCKELSYLKQRFGSEIFIYFDDDTFNLKANRTIEISEHLKSIGLKWGAMCRIDTLNKDEWEELSKNNLISVNVGLETVSPNLIDTINKKLNVEDAIENIKFLNTLGINTHVTFMEGIPGETEDDVQKMKQVYQELNIDSKQLSHYIPFPGTPAYNSQVIVEQDYDGFKKRRNIFSDVDKDRNVVDYE